MSKWMEFPKKKDHKLSEQEFTRYCDTLFEAIIDCCEQKADIPLWKMYIDNFKTMGKIKRKRDESSFEMRDKPCYWTFLST